MASYRYLFKTRRFLPLFIVQFGGALNDNLFKSAMLVLVAFRLTDDVSTASTINNLAAGLFILPFFLFSPLAGQLADRLQKRRLVQPVKLAEIAIMIIGSIALYIGTLSGLLFILFLLGTQSSLFGPAKYAILPQLLNREELVAGNAQIASGTFLAILIGTILGGLLAKTEVPALWIGIIGTSIAICGWIASRFIPDTEIGKPDLKINWNPISTSMEGFKLARRIPAVWICILGISWFWFLGSAYLTQIPNFVRYLHGGSELVVTLLLAAFTIGIALGAHLCEKASGPRVEIGLVPLGSLGLTLFGLNLAGIAPTYIEDSHSLASFLTDPKGLNILIDIVGLGVFGGFYIIPLYSQIQMLSPNPSRSRILGANNVVNALFMVCAALLGLVILSYMKLSIDQMFAILAWLNLPVVIYICWRVPIFLLRCLAWILGHTFYRIRYKNLNQIPEKGPALLVCNHVSYADPILLFGAVHRPIRFIMYDGIFRWRLFNWMFRLAGAIPICSPHENRKVYLESFEEAAKVLDTGQLLLIFPEGGLSPDGNIGTFRRGVEKILERNPVPVIPMAITGLWGSLFSRRGGPVLLKWPRRLWSRVEIIAGDVIDPEEVKAPMLREKVAHLRGDRR